MDTAHRFASEHRGSGATSVIIPCYNAQEYLFGALESVRAQTVSVREIIVVDDGSTVPVRAPAGWRGPPLQIIRTPNQGPSAARNRGLARAAGDFIALLDADDTWDERKIETQERALQSDAAAIASYTRCVNGAGLFAFGPYPPSEVSDDEFLLMLWYHSFFPPSAVMFRRAAIAAVGMFDEDLRISEDIAYWFRLLTVGRFVQVAEPLCRYRQHPGQATTNLYRRVAGSKRTRVTMIARHGSRLVQAGLRQDKLWDAYRNEILIAFYRRRFDAARPLLWDYWKDHPGDVAILARAVVSLLPGGLVAHLRGTLESPTVHPAAISEDDGSVDAGRWAREFQRLASVMSDSSTKRKW